MEVTEVVPLADQSHVAGARRAAIARAKFLGFDEVGAGRAGIVASELATNIVKYGSGGRLLLNGFGPRGNLGLEIIGIDGGEGIADLGKAMTDGYSTGGTMGSGLGAIRRQADEFAIYSHPGRGTAVLARLVRQHAPPQTAAPIGSVMLAHPDETSCGDDWAYADTTAGPTLFMADGSGHGASAQAAALAGIAAFLARPHLALPELMGDVHRAMTHTRGAAAAIARLDYANRVARFVGVGNISAALLHGEETRRMVSMNGIVGHISGRPREFTYPLAPGSLLIMHSDGVSMKWDAAHYPGLAMTHPALVASVLLRDHGRGRDDATVVCVRGD